MEFTVGGKLRDAAGVRAGAQPSKPRVKRDGADKYHRGWSVEGFPPGAIDKAREDHERRHAQWLAMTPEAAAKAIKDNKRDPGPWNEARFVAKTKRTKVRPRPFDAKSASIDAERLAVSSGWDHVVIVELSKGDPPQAGLF